MKAAFVICKLSTDSCNIRNSSLFQKRKLYMVYMMLKIETSYFLKPIFFIMDVERVLCEVEA